MKTLLDDYDSYDERLKKKLMGETLEMAKKETRAIAL
jgi:hypothetical protein